MGLKKLILFLLPALFLCLTGQAQTFKLTTSPSSATTTVTNTNVTVQYLYTQPVKMPVPSLVSLQYTGIKSSGFIKGSVTLEASIDGTAYKPVATDSLTFTNAAQNTYVWDVVSKQRVLYRFVIRTIDSTQSLISTGAYLK